MSCFYTRPHRQGTILNRRPLWLFNYSDTSIVVISKLRTSFYKNV